MSNHVGHVLANGETREPVVRAGEFGGEASSGPAAAPVSDLDLFSLIVAKPNRDDDPLGVAQLASELEHIVATANRAVAAARERVRRARAIGVNPGCCLGCGGLGQAVGQCAECCGSGRSA